MADRGNSPKRAAKDGSAPQRSAKSHSNGAKPPSPVELARRASEQLGELVGREPEGVVSLDRSDDGGGWQIGVEVVETHRIPDTADVLAVYEVDVDKHGELVGYRRVRRYQRGRTQDEQ